MNNTERDIAEIPKPLPKDMLYAFSIPEIPEVEEGDDIAEIIAHGMQQFGGLQQRDILVVASKIVSKSEGRLVHLDSITPSQEAIDLFNRLKRKSPELIQLILDNSEKYKVENNVIVARNSQGFQMTSAGVDSYAENTAILVPEDPDRSALRVMNHIKEQTGKDVAIVISDSEGRADRRGAGAISIGVAGIDPLRVKNVTLDTGKVKKTEETISDMLANQAALLMGQRGNNTPVVCIRGFNYSFNPEANLQSIIHQL